ncbi:MAG TPA: hypothetical protein VN896_12285 [Methylomirabilota bacterium]|nr:hypothetical protein [Methylomirabilota bacterium]
MAALVLADPFVVNESVATLRLGGGAFAIGLEGPAALPSTNDVMREAFMALDIDPETVTDADIVQGDPGMNVLIFASPAFAIPERGVSITVAGVPLRVAFLQRLPVSVDPTV